MTTQPVTQLHPSDPPPPPVATVLANAGQPIRLIDGAQVNLRYSMASLRQLESRFGSIAGIQVELKAAQQALQSAAKDDLAGARGAVFTILSDAVAAGLLHVRVQHPDTGQRVRLGTDVDLVMEQLDPGQLQPMLDAFATALSEAFGTVGKEAGATMQQAAQSLSPGESGTTLPSSSADDLTGSSGA